MLAAALGAFPEISRLNPEFVPARLRLKLTLRIDACGVPATGALFAALEASFPTMARHRCCGSGSLRSRVSEGAAPQEGAGSDPDPGVDVAHLVEHLVIDIQHFVGRMTICSGVTCAYRSPPDRYDIFVESPEEKVGLLAASVAVGVSEDLLAGRGVDPHYRCVVETARCARDGAGRPLRSLVAPLERVWGGVAVSQAIDYLRIQGFLAEHEASARAGVEPDLVYDP